MLLPPQSPLRLVIDACQAFLLLIVVVVSSLLLFLCGHQRWTDNRCGWPTTDKSSTSQVRLTVAADTIALFLDGASWQRVVNRCLRPAMQHSALKSVAAAAAIVADSLTLPSTIATSLSRIKPCWRHNHLRRPRPLARAPPQAFVAAASYNCSLPFCFSALTATATVTAVAATIAGSFVMPAPASIAEAADWTVELKVAWRAVLATAVSFSRLRLLRSC